MKDIDFENIDLSFDPIFYHANIRYDINDIINKLISYSKEKSEYNIKNIIKNQHELIFKYDNLVNNNRELVQYLFTNNEVCIFFLNILDSIIGLLELSTEEIIFINKLVYDFFEYTKTNKYYNENEIKDKLLSITYKINANRIRALSAFIGINKANILSIISYSSFIDEKVVHRVNDFVVSNIRINNVNDLLNFYNVMFTGLIINKESDFTNKARNYIIHSMLEYWDNSLDHNIDEYNMFNNISRMISYIFAELASTSNQLLYDLLRDYGNIIKLLNIDSSKTRYSLDKAYKDFLPIRQIIYDLEIEHDIFIP